MTSVSSITFALILLLVSVARNSCLARSTTPLVATRFIRALKTRSNPCSDWHCRHPKRKYEKQQSNKSYNRDICSVGNQEAKSMLDVSRFSGKSPKESSFLQKGRSTFSRTLRSTRSAFSGGQESRKTSFVAKPKTIERPKHSDETKTLLDTGDSSQTPSGTKATSLKLQGGATAALVARPLVFWENMVCGAISRSVAQTIMHPANTMKTMLQSRMETQSFGTLMSPKNFHRLTVGAGANFVLSLPHGAVNFAVLEFVRSKLTQLLPAEAGGRLGPGLDFVSSCISTVCCSVVSTPQMMITDNIMAGNYPNLPAAARGLYQQRGIAGFYAGWFPGLAGKIPSYVSNNKFCSCFQ